MFNMLVGMSPEPFLSRLPDVIPPLKLNKSVSGTKRKLETFPFQKKYFLQLISQYTERQRAHPWKVRSKVG